MGSRRRSVLKAGLGLAAGVVVGAGLLGNLTGAAPAPSQDVDRYPNRPVKLVVPIAAGGRGVEAGTTKPCQLSTA